MTTTRPGSTTKVCPRCAEEIKTEAKVCHYCRAEFVIERHGYCAHCHAVVTVDQEGETCPVCTGPLVDIMTDSHLVETAPAPAPAPAPQAVTDVPPRSEGAVAPSQVGPLRAAVVPTMLQWVTIQLTALAIAALALMPILGNVSENFALKLEDTNAIVQKGYTLGPLFFVIAVVMAILMPWRAMPKKVQGSRIKARAGDVAFLKKVRTEFHTRALYRAGWYVARLSAVAVLWVASIALFFWVSDLPAGYVRGNGTPITWAILGVGLVATLMTIPYRRPRHILLDDEGTFFPVEGEENPS